MNFLITSVIRNEAPRLQKWLDFWSGYDLLVLDQCSTDTTIELLKDVEHYQTSAYDPFCEPDLNLLQAMSGKRWAIRVDVDEFIEPDHLKKMWSIINSPQNDGIDAWFLRRQNLINGRDMSYLQRNQRDPQGHDWQLRITRNSSAQFNQPHTYPHIKTRFGYLDPSYYIRHERDYEDVVARNMGRMKDIPDNQKQMQVSYLNALKAIFEGAPNGQA